MRPIILVVITAVAIGVIVLLASREAAPAKKPVSSSDPSALTPEERALVGSYGSIRGIDSGFGLRLKEDRSYLLTEFGIGSERSVPVNGNWSLQRGAIVLKPLPEKGPWPLEVLRENGKVYLGDSKFGYQKSE
jgi:hypothetical protein